MLIVCILQDRRFPVHPPYGKGLRVAVEIGELGTAQVPLLTVVEMYRRQLHAALSPGSERGSTRDSGSVIGGTL